MNRILPIITILICISIKAYTQEELKHFIFFSRDRELIHDSTFYDLPGVHGAQITYAWKWLEPGKEEYDFHEIEEDLQFLSSKNKKLFIQIQDVTFTRSRNLVPAYMVSDTSYHGGAEAQYWTGANGKLEKGGWVARRWDPAVADQFRKLLIALGRQFDGRIEGINLPETAVDLVDDEGDYPKGFTREAYVDELKKTMLTLRTSFKKSVVLLYANFMPENSRQDLKALYDYAVEIGHGMGGPDIKVYKEGQMRHSYPLIKSVADKVKTGVAVQHGNYEEINPKTGKQVTVPEILDFAKNYLQLNYIFWCTQEPYYTQQVQPLLRSLVR